MEEKLQLRTHGEASLPTLIYLPGIHGDWTLIGSFRKAIAGRVRFVEITYPRTLTWSLDEYAAAIESALAQNGITEGWLLGESFGSQVLWTLAGRSQATGSSGVQADGLTKRHFGIQGLILAGGFVKHPSRSMIWLAEKLTARMSSALMVWIIFGYAKFARFRFRHSPETLAKIDEFIERRTDLDRRAAQHRLHLIAGYDPRPIARQTRLPVFGLSGIVDPIVPWPFVRAWLRKNCPALQDYKVIRRADHNVLSTAPREAVKQVMQWMNSKIA